MLTYHEAIKIDAVVILKIWLVYLWSSLFSSKITRGYQISSVKIISARHVEQVHII